MSENTIVLTTDDKTATALVATIKAAVNGDGKYAAYVKAHNVTTENVKDHAFALAVLTYPNGGTVQSKRHDDGSKTRTPFGNAVQKASAGLRGALEPVESDETPVQALLTKAGFAATRDEVIAAWESAQV